MLRGWDWLAASTALVVVWMATGSVAQEPATEAKPNEAIELLDQATEAKLFAERMSDLDKVVDLCRQAIDQGLPDAEKATARELLSATLFEKASRVLAPVLEGQLDASWPQRQRMALKSLKQAMEVTPDNGEVHLLFAQLADLRGGDREAGKMSAEKAVQLLWKNPVRRSEALLTRAEFQEDPQAKRNDLDQAVEADGTNVDALRERGTVRLADDRPDEAIADFLKVLELDDEDSETRGIIIQLLTVKEEYDKAIEIVNRAIAKDDLAAEGYILRSGIYAMQDEFEKAMDDINHAVELEPSNVVALLSRSQLFAEREAYDEALADIDRALELRPGFSRALLMRSSVAQLSGDFEAAIRDLRRILRRNPDNVPLRLQIAAVYVMDQRPRKAIELYSRILEEDKNELEAWRGRADARLAIGEHQKAIADYEQALTIDADASGILNNLAWVMATSTMDEVRDAQRSIELAEKACELTDYGAAHILSTLAAGYAEAGDFEQAVKWSEKALEVGADGDIQEQLAKELQSYLDKQPWRERQEQTERIEEEEPSLSDLDTGSEAANVPSDP